MFRLLLVQNLLNASIACEKWINKSKMLNASNCIQPWFNNLLSHIPKNSCSCFLKSTGYKINLSLQEQNIIFRIKDDVDEIQIFFDEDWCMPTFSLFAETSAD